MSAPRSSRRRPLIVAASVVLVVAVAFGLYWFQPWKLFVDERVDEALPAVAPVATSTAAPTTAPASPTSVTVSAIPTSPSAVTSVTSAPVTTSSVPSPSSSPTTPSESSSSPSPSPSPTAPVRTAVGELISHEHETTGTVAVVTYPDGRRVLTVENLATSNGPDVHVWLAAAPVVEGEAGWYLFDDEEYLDLGALKGNLGNQVYEIPAEADLSTLTSVSLWCERFAVSFGAATLQQA